jgi:hypothetical protein
MTHVAIHNGVEGASNLCGDDRPVAEAMSGHAPLFLRESKIDFHRIKSSFAIALHMHQPLIPAGGDDLASAEVIGNLQFMLDHPQIQDAHNAPTFLQCYRRMADFIPALLGEGAEPRVMLDYSGCLLYALRQMGQGEVLDSLRRLALDRDCRRCVEWLGTAWGHAVAPSTPPGDFRLHVRAWQHHFASVFGLEALSRVRGFSPPEMALPNHPDICFEFVRTLKECGYRWLLLQEHTVENADGGRVSRPYVPHRLIARSSRGETLSIIALIKTQGSDTKLVGQMQPYYEAKGVGRTDLGGKSIPQLVTQISDGENGGVIMNEFPSKYMQVMREASHSETPPMNVTEYLEHLSAAGVDEGQLPVIQPIFHRRIFDRLGTKSDPNSLNETIAALRTEDHRFHVEGGSWTADASWVRGYENVLGPMEQASALFARKSGGNIDRSTAAYQDALFYLLNSQTSCFRYWGSGPWTDYGREFCRRAIDAAQRL